MSDSVDKSAPSPAKRGQEAWNAARARIAGRNGEARKEGKQRRDAYEREKEHRRKAEEQREQAHLHDMNEERPSSAPRGRRQGVPRAPDRS